MNNWQQFLLAVLDDEVWPKHLKAGLVAWAIPESGRGITQISKYANNFHSMKYRGELGHLYPKKYAFENNVYFAFDSPKQELECLWKFIHRQVYCTTGDPDKHMTSITDLLSFIGPTYCPPAYQQWWITSHRNCNYHQYVTVHCLPEAKRLLAELGWEEESVNMPAPVEKGYSVHNGLLYLNDNPVPFYETSNKNKWVRNEPRNVIFHYTASLGVKGICGWFQNPKSQVSAHLLIGRDGWIHQFVPFHVPAWHSGSSKYNRLSIGIELEGLGCSRVAVGDNVIFTGWGGIKTVPKSECVYAPHKLEPRIFRWWPKFTDAQYDTINAILPVLRAEYEPHYGRMVLMGHEDVCKGKIDPGCAFMWRRILGG